MRGFNVSPSSAVEGKKSRAANDDGSLNSSRMTGTQELSIHEGMQVMHEMENQQNKKNTKGQKKKKKTTTTNDCSEVVFNLGSLNTDNLKNNQESNLADQSKTEQQDIDIDDNIVQYTIEQFLDENGCDSELRTQNKNSSRLEKKSNTGATSNRSSNRHGNLF